MSSRRSRRRYERQRGKSRRPTRGLPVAVRVLLVLGGLAVLVAGILLLSRGDPNTARRLGRLAGMLVILGMVGIGVGAIGRL